MADDDEQLQHDLELLAAEIKQWKKRWNDPLLLLRRAYQLLAEIMALSSLGDAVVVLRHLTAPISPWW